MSLTLAQARTVVLAYLRQVQPAGPGRGSPQVLGPPETWDKVARQLGMALDKSDFLVIRQVFHELYLERVIITGSPQGDSMCWPFYRITDYGRTILASGEYVPHDSDGYIARLKREVPSIDAVIIRYLDEALGCYRSGFLLAAAVMTGCAAEKAILLLVETYAQAIADAAKKAKFEKDTQPWMISKKYEALWKRLEPAVPSIPPDLGDDLHTVLDRTFDLIRTTRNSAGHPAGKPLDHDAVHANLILFPVYCKRVYGLIGHFAKNPVV